MGYTHYWEVPADLEPSSFAAWAADVGKIIEACPDISLTDVTLGPDEVYFNGDYETFAVRREALDFAFCKTAEYPYDIVVTAALLRLLHHCPSVRVSSDGDMEGEDWAPAVALVKELFP